ncbi:RNA polymerase sigma factor for flagellar operon FliA [Roseateles sp. YR242]|uniref:sigma-70 family RNA polymerase sigma factor n=1 Tax=Roseateles sp. YR242 TaxID=1855305 RepID=UPI0008C85B71|nr:sigma-70 family RNA polymerase sigma factor [Roseateles sp. YR242]SEK92792.1 RNA polymerase sigma factor for flagellar operon FliA [Roseateles sp. YR242]
MSRQSALSNPASPASWAPERENELWSLFRASGDQALRQQLISHYLDYARVVAATYYARRIHDEIEFAEYHQLASLALVESIDRYDPDKGAQFKTFASRRMHGAILDGIERLTEKQQQIAVRQRLRKERLESVMAQDQRPGTPVPDAKAAPEDLFRYLAEVGIGIALGCLLDDTGMMAREDGTDVDIGLAPLAYQRVEMKQLRARLHDLVRHLPAQEYTVISLHYIQEHSFEDIATRLELTKSRISQIHRRGLQLLRDKLHASRAVDVAW